MSTRRETAGSTPVSGVLAQGRGPVRFATWPALVGALAVGAALSFWAGPIILTRAQVLPFTLQIDTEVARGAAAARGWVAPSAIVVGVIAFLIGLECWSDHAARRMRRRMEVHTHSQVVSAPRIESQARHSARCNGVFQPEIRRAPSGTVAYRLIYTPTWQLVRSYAGEAAALGFVRDVVRLGGRQAAAQFALQMAGDGGEPTMVAAGEELMRRALEDRIL